jgi:hypothetical protein
MSPFSRKEVYGREVLQKALDHGGYVPERDPKQLGPVLVSEAESIYGIDGTERPRQRPRDAEKGLDHGVGHFRPLSITRQCHLLAYHCIAMRHEGLRQVF